MRAPRNSLNLFSWVNHRQGKHPSVNGDYLMETINMQFKGQLTEFQGNLNVKRCMLNLLRYLCLTKND